MNNYEWLLFCNFQPFRMAIHSWYSLFAHIIICHICWSEPLSGFSGNFTLHSTRDPSLFLSLSLFLSCWRRFASEANAGKKEKICRRCLRFSPPPRGIYFCGSVGEWVVKMPTFARFVLFVTLHGGVRSVTSEIYALYCYYYYYYYLFFYFKYSSST